MHASHYRALGALCLFVASVGSALGANGIFNVRDYGAVGDGTHLDTAALNKAVDACVQAGGGTVLVPAGKYLTGTVILKSHVALDVDSGATLLASTEPGDYPETKNAWGEGHDEIAPLVYAEDAENVTITGRGTLDGQGKLWWRRLELTESKRRKAGPLTDDEKVEAQKISRGRPQLIRLERCKDVLIEHVNLLNSPEWNVHPLFCENVKIDGISIKAPPSEIGPGASHNTDGINPEGCKTVIIANCKIDNGDDGITLKSGINELGRKMGRPIEDVVITNCTMYHSHGGVTIGSEMSGGARNITVTNCVFRETGAGIRIKSQRGRGGVVEGITVSNIVMQDVKEAFQITTFYSGKDTASETHPVDEGTPRYRDFHFLNITARGSHSAGIVTGLKELPIGDVTFDQVYIQAETGFTCTNATDIRFHDVQIDTQSGASLTLHNSTAIEYAGVFSRTPHNDAPVVSDESAPPLVGKSGTTGG